LLFEHNLIYESYKNCTTMCVPPVLYSLETKNPITGRGLNLDYMPSITATCSINLHFVEAPRIEALIEYKT